MHDIYHQLVRHAPDFRNFSDEDLLEHCDICVEASRTINHTLTLIGNLMLEASQCEDYSDENAKRDLMLVGDTLRTLPRMAEALEQNSDTATYVFRKRRGEFKL